MTDNKIFPYLCGARFIKILEARSSNETDKKVQERHTGVSPAVLSELRFDESSSDRSLLFHENARLMDTNKPFSIYIVERKDWFQSSQCVIIEQTRSDSSTLFGLGTITEQIRLTPQQLLSLKKEIDRLLDFLFPQERELRKPRIGLVKVYSRNWLQSEMNRLLKLERYEDAEALKYLIRIISDTEKSKPNENNTCAGNRPRNKKLQVQREHKDRCE